MAQHADADVVVVGGGLAGLSAAVHVARGGRRVVLLERAKSLGGRARSQEQGGFRFNLGPHALYRHGAAARLLAELGAEATGGVPGAGAFALQGGRLHTLPSGPVSLLTTDLLPPLQKLELARALAALMRTPHGAFSGLPLSEILQMRVRGDRARAVAAMLFRLATYCAEAEHLDAGIALAQLQHALSGNVLYVDGGWQTLVDGLAARAREAGVAWHTGARAVAADAQGVQLADGGRVWAACVVLAVPPAEAAQLVPQDAALAAPVRPVRAACLDVALRRLPRPRHLILLGVDAPLYTSVHSLAARLAPPGGAVVQAARYLRADEPAPAREELEMMLDTLQPGWREEVESARFLPSLTVMNALPEASRRGARVPVSSPARPGVLVAGDWVGAEPGLLVDVALASAHEAAQRALELVAVQAAA
ncbi:FAD-dependent oxidoreductase [Aggregicoccus sp. 17bor-14]|uniref:phytoene desaturase family protein n=1 Tax=Myxococcaceae TaxID=31 RepID=UPI00129CAB9F|nr:MULTISPECIES: FAD-dependent oxidoreductase [Myxococcaceae]MBF5043869.1 FAD-dependent oxidoreductase [Simulacricoccus sp. 17bor-14]MRI89621.1 FAD-dependent oxidoreductase [Aggregicoccus sp. 17bor-14]